MSQDSVVNDVIDSFVEFLHTYEVFRKENGLCGNIANPYEILTAMTDKLGRCCRQVKHFERNDPKPDWPDGMTEEMAGLIIYWILLKNKYNLDLVNGFRNELMKAVEQHGNRGE